MTHFKSSLVKLSAAAALSIAGFATVNSASANTTVQAATNDVVTVKYTPGYGIAVWTNYEGGHTTGQTLKHGTAWKVVSNAKDSKGNTWYELGRNQWIQAQYTVAGDQSAQLSASATSDKVGAIISLAKQQLGKPYVWGASGSNAFDCSGLTSYVYSHAAGKNIGRTTYQQLNAGQRVSVKNLQPGDLVFWGNCHVGIYIGNNQYIHAPQPGESVKVASISSYFYPSYGVRVLQ